MKVAHKDGPAYPDLGSEVARFRQIKNPTRAQKRAHGDAVGKAIRAKQRSELQRELPSFRSNCASGTWANTPEAIERAIRDQHRNELLNYPGKVRRNRTQAEWQALYKQAMEEKRKCLTAAQTS